jgi:hypothetical protein
VHRNRLRHEEKREIPDRAGMPVSGPARSWKAPKIKSGGYFNYLALPEFSWLILAIELN